MKIPLLIAGLFLITACSTSIKDLTEQVKAALKNRQSKENSDSKTTLNLVKTSPKISTPINVSIHTPTTANTLPDQPYSRFSKADLWEKCYQDIIRLPAGGSLSYQRITDIEVIDSTKTDVKADVGRDKNGELSLIHYTLNADWKFTYTYGNATNRSGKWHFRNIDCRFSEFFNLGRDKKYRFTGGAFNIKNPEKVEDVPEEMVESLTEISPDQSLLNSEKVVDVCLISFGLKQDSISLLKDETKIEPIRWLTPLAKQVHGSQGGFYYKVTVKYDNARFTGNNRTCEIINSPDKGLILRKDY